MGFGARLKHAWSSFTPPDEIQSPRFNYELGAASSYRPDRRRYGFNNERTIISSIYTRLSVDVASVKIEHVRLDDNDQYLETIKSGLNNCLNVEANIDQAARHFRQDIALTLFQEGVIAILPVDTTINPAESGSWDVKTLRVGTILEWWPQYVKVRAYNEKTGAQEEIIVPKSVAAIVENPFYSVMNEPNSTLQRLIHKLSLLDNVDEISSSGKLDIIIQLPYPVRSETKRQQAMQRRQDLEDQLSGSTYGIAYADGTEKITQLNRAVENNLLAQVQYLKEELYNELGLTEALMNGTADDVTMLNYINRMIEPVMDAVTEAMARTFITKTARTQGQSVQYFQTPFKLLPISQLADVIDALSRNQIITPNEVRPALGLKPSKEPQANQTINSNMPIDKQVTSANGDPNADPNAAVDDTNSLTQADLDEARLKKSMSDLGL